MFAFLGSTLGVSVYKHYCGEFLEGVSLYFQTNPCADEGGEDACQQGKQMDCCDDETEFHQLKVNLIKNSNEQESINPLVYSAFILFQLTVEEQLNDQQAYLFTHEIEYNYPPKFIRYHRLTLYG